MKLQSLLAGCEWGWGRISVEIIPLNLYFRLRRNIKKYQGTSIETMYLWEELRGWEEDEGVLCGGESPKGILFKAEK